MKGLFAGCLHEVWDGRVFVLGKEPCKSFDALSSNRRRGRKRRPSSMTPRRPAIRAREPDCLGVSGFCTALGVSGLSLLSGGFKGLGFGLGLV